MWRHLVSFRHWKISFFQKNDKVVNFFVQVYPIIFFLHECIKIKIPNNIRQKYQSQKASPRGGKRVKFHRKNLSNKIDISSKNIKNTESPGMILKVLQRPLIKSYEQFNDFDIWSKVTTYYFNRKNYKIEKIKFQPRRDQKNVTSKMNSKVVQEPSIESYDHFTIFPRK